jgi:hypothetical protein
VDSIVGIFPDKTSNSMSTSNPSTFRRCFMCLGC